MKRITVLKGGNKKDGYAYYKYVWRKKKKRSPMRKIMNKAKEIWLMELEDRVDRRTISMIDLMDLCGVNHSDFKFDNI